MYPDRAAHTQRIEKIPTYGRGIVSNSGSSY
jgi:hypothetical protein